jgi:hypothetical protein
MMIDDDTLKQLLRINDELLQLCKWLNKKRDMETSSRLIPLVDGLTPRSDRSRQKQTALDPLPQLKRPEVDYGENNLTEAGPVRSSMRSR